MFSYSNYTVMALVAFVIIVATALFLALLPR